LVLRRHKTPGTRNAAITEPLGVSSIASKSPPGPGELETKPKLTTAGYGDSPNAAASTAKPYVARVKNSASSVLSDAVVWLVTLIGLAASGKLAASSAATPLPNHPAPQLRSVLIGRVYAEDFGLPRIQSTGTGLRVALTH